VGDGGLPLTVVTTATSVHDSQVAIPLAKLTAGPLSGVCGGSRAATPPLQTYGKRFESVDC